MHYLTEEHLFLFLVQILILLGCSRGLGLLFSRIGQPAITAEILVGICLGPTLLGRTLPGVYDALFPEDPVQNAMLMSVGWLGLLFFLLVSGMDTDLSSVWRQKGKAVLISVSDLTLPMAIAFAACILLPRQYLANDQRVVFALFMAAILTISALPVTARVLQELGIYKTDVGLLIMSALTINDVAGWVVFALILGSTADQGMTYGQIAFVLISTFAFTGFMLTLGRQFTHKAFKTMHGWGLPEPGASLTFICLLGIVGGALTLQIGIHALFGFFIVGIMAGDSSALSANTRHVITQMVRAVLVPLFFASIGLHIDFLAGFDPFIVVFLLFIGTFGRYFGAWVGAWLSRQPREHYPIISIAHVPGGEMQIVVGMLALEYGVITETVFIGILFGAIFSSIILAPWLKRALNRRKTDDIIRYFALETLAPDMQTRTREESIRELALMAAKRTQCADADTVVNKVLAREKIMGTALENGVAIPHARIEGLAEPVIAVGRSAAGIEWNSIDGKPTHLIFLILTALGETDEQVKILRAIAMAMRNQTDRDALLNAGGNEGMWTVLRTIVTKQ